MKKTISILLALVLTVGSFSACSKDGKEETTTAAPAAYTLAYTYDSHYAQTDPSAVRAYEKIAKAIAEGGVAVRVNTDMMDDVNRLLSVDGAGGHGFGEQRQFRRDHQI
jgi:outer membrane lipoprotein-sorting protein